MKGYLITFEGIDGSGKSTQANLIRERLETSGRKAIILREPGGTVIGEKIRSLLLDNSFADMQPHTELFLYLAARAQITASVIVPALNRGEDVIMDRYIDSTAAYQGYGRGLGIEEMIQLNMTATGGLVPDMTFVIDCDPEKAIGRLTSAPDRLESEGIEFMKKVREGFLALHELDAGRIFICDGNRGIDEIENDIVSILRDKLKITSL
ncbi:dTMP kinase [Candidatus Latescibacterota bacterium]